MGVSYGDLLAPPPSYADSMMYSAAPFASSTTGGRGAASEIFPAAAATARGASNAMAHTTYGGYGGGSAGGSSDGGSMNADPFAPGAARFGGADVAPTRPLAVRTPRAYTSSVEGVLDVTVSDPGLRSVSLGHVLEGVVDFFAPLAEDALVEVELEPHEEVFVSGDSNLLHELFGNLNLK